VAGLADPRAAGVVLGRTAEVLGHIAEPGQAAVIWTRGRAPAGGAPTEIRHMVTGDVGIFRGSLWPGDAPAGLVHRSPPLSGGGGVRLLLVLDALEAGHG
jgi:hypothetical protein